MGDDQLRELLDRIGAVQSACDLDLLLFFHHHPTSLLTSEQIVAAIGYERERVARSIEGLIEGGFLTRSPNPAHAARLYVLQETVGPPGDLTALLAIGSTRAGRAQLLSLLATSATTSAAPGLEPARDRLRARVLKIA